MTEIKDIQECTETNLHIWEDKYRKSVVNTEKMKDLLRCSNVYTNKVLNRTCITEHYITLWKHKINRKANLQQSQLHLH